MEHSAVLLTCIKIPHGFQTFVLSTFEWPLKRGFTVYICLQNVEGGSGSMISEFIWGEA